jgi:putative peptidoglycan lipid II flippase
VAAPVVTALFAPGFHDDPEKFALTAEMIRITFPYLFLISMTGFAGAILNTYGRFAIPAFTPVLLNVTLITAAVVASPWFEEPAMALAWGVMIAGVLQLTFQLPFLHRLHLLPRPRMGWHDPGVRRIMTLMVPALFGVSVSQINLLLDTVIASFLPTGSVSWLYYSDRLVELPLGVFAIAIATVILPSLSKLKAQADSDRYAQTIDWAMRSVLLLGVPAAAGLLILAEPILITLFQYGELVERDVTMAALSLRAYSFGLLACMLIKVLAPGYFAQQDMKTPVRIGIIAMVANMVFNIALVVPLHHYYQIGHVGLAAATALSGWLNAILLLQGLRKRGSYHHQAGWPRYLVRLSLATTAMVITIVILNPEQEFWLAQGWLGRVAAVLGVISAGGGMYIGVLFALGLRFRHFRQVNTSI